MAPSAQAAARTLHGPDVLADSPDWAPTSCVQDFVPASDRRHDTYLLTYGRKMV